MNKMIYKICPIELWHQAEAAGEFTGAPIDIQDGYIHFSTAEQSVETAAKHFAGQPDLYLIAVDGDKLGSELKYEVSRGNALFPHLYANLKLDAVAWVKPLPLGDDGMHIFPNFNDGEDT